MKRDLFIPTTMINTWSVGKFLRTYCFSDEQQQADQKTGNLGYGWVHYAMIRTIKPARVLCIGSRLGFVPAVCALACRDNQFGVVDFVDAGYDEAVDMHHWGGAGVWKKVDATRYFNRFHVGSYIRMHVTTTQAFAKTSHGPWGYISIDGDHSYRGVLHDYTKFWPHLSEGGAMAFHDIYVKRMGKLIFGVSTLWDRVKKKYPHETMEYPGLCGLGIVRKPVAHVSYLIV